MTANTLLLVIISFVVLEFIFGKVLDFLNSKSWSNPLPKLVQGLYDKEKYNKAKNYAKVVMLILLRFLITVDMTIWRF